MRPKKIILCVDDNEQLLSVRTFLLETRGYRVIALTNPHDAIETIANSLPGSIDLLLCDLLMPLMDGNELVRRAKQLHPTLPAMIEMLERIRILVARKRGPRKMSLASPPSPNFNVAASA